MSIDQLGSGASASADRATHEPSQQAVSALRVGIPSEALLQGDRYSPNLRKWVAKEIKRFPFPITMYRDLEGQLWLGWIDEGMWFIGARLNRVLTVGTKAEAGCWTFPVTELTEVVGFWSRYASVGRCAIDEAHDRWWLGHETRWHTEGDTRRCLWCGHHTQVLRRWTETVERKRWTPQGIEAGTAETGTGSVHESPVGNADAQNPYIPGTTL